MSRISTKFTNLLRIRTPVVSAPMAGASGGNLAAQVTLGGGFGLLAAGYDTPDKFLSELSVARSALRVESHSRLPIGVGYLGWQLEKPHSPALELLSLALENNVQAVWFAFGNNLGQWVRHVRDHDQKAGRDQGTIIFAQVSSVEEALTAANDWKVDVLVAQGIEAGGHGANYAPPVLTLVSSILSALPEDGPPVLAAGGLANGGHVASLITLGASGVVFGTRFLLSPESLYSDVQRKALLAASSTSSVRTMAFDHARGTLGWPHGIDGRGLRNQTVDDYEKGIDIQVLRSKFAEGVRAADPDRMIVWAGTGVGLMNKVMPAKDIVAELHQDCVEHMRVVADRL